MKRLVFFIALVTLSCACNKTPNVLADGTFHVFMTADLPALPILEEDYDTKASTLYTVRINWSAGDQLSVVNLTTGRLLGGHLTADKSGTATTFSGTLSGTVHNGDRIAYFYPAQSNGSEIPFPGIHVDMASQKGTSNAVPLCVYSIVTAGPDSFQSAQISFNYLMSYIMIGMSDIPASTQIKSVTISNVTQSFDVSINALGNEFNITPQVGDITLTPSQAATAAGARSLYIAVPGSSSATRNITLETPTTSFETTFTSAALKNGTAYNTNVSGFLRDDLSFEDSHVRAYCLAHFDLNGDGKLSLVEIASISSFPSVPMPSDILCFNELELFYGLTSLPSFQNFIDLTSITIPQQITTIPNLAFSGCSSLVKVYLKPTTPPQLGQDAFLGVSESLMLIVPDESLEAYQTAPGWSNLHNNIWTISSAQESNVRIHTEGNEMNSENATIVVH